MQLNLFDFHVLGASEKPFFVNAPAKTPRPLVVSFFFERLSLWSELPKKAPFGLKEQAIVWGRFSVRASRYVRRRINLPAFGFMS